ncbi:protein DYAD-like [Magnolia sinica]|uniref:protein DYAD-like n=1 Tax=Magnolia sinica TaxID=86752 RepID=UPI00265A6EEA|nr:protein DYAD-like [Magnolia sinica]
MEAAPYKQQLAAGESMVSEKTRLNVTVIFPSILSLRKCFCSEADKGQSPNAAGEAHPALDEQFVMGMNVAGKVLRRYIPPSEFARQKHMESFWEVSPKAEAGVKTEARTSPEKKAFLEVCRSELKCDGLVSWGVRRKVRYIGQHREMPPFSGFITKEEDADRADGKRVAKRPRGGPSSNDRSRKEPRRDSKDRWSKERYETAELKLVDIMQAEGAVLGNPILRPELRAEARKYIGDTGLLDHLLKHMAGKVVPQRDVRFRRRHNPEGAMEYWLEQADLIDLRREAGVQDPYWAPPPGWKPGDGPVMDAACARELKQLKEQMADMRRNFEELLDKKHGSEEPLTQTNGDKACNITVSTAAQESLLDSGSSSSLQESYKSLVTRKCVLEEQLSEISNSLDGIQEEMKKLVSEVERAKKRAEPEAEGKPCMVVRSGFRICKPQGTFLWPSNASSISPQLQVEDFLAVPTPPSASSATSAPPLPLAPPKPGSPVKPMPQIRATLSVARADHYEKISDRTGSSGSLSSFHHDILPRVRIPDAAFPLLHVRANECGAPTCRSPRADLITALPASSDDGESELAARDLEPSDAVAGSRTIADPTHPDFSAGSWLALSIPHHSLVRF